jgi:hypothetical protein
MGTAGLRALIRTYIQISQMIDKIIPMDDKKYNARRYHVVIEALQSDYFDTRAKIIEFEKALPIC